MSFFDLTLPIENGMTYYPGDPEPRVVAFLEKIRRAFAI